MLHNPHTRREPTIPHPAVDALSVDGVPRVQGPVLAAELYHSHKEFILTQKLTVLLPEPRPFAPPPRRGPRGREQRTGGTLGFPEKRFSGGWLNSGGQAAELETLQKKQTHGDGDVGT